jgi:hypothetical protein
MTTFTAISNSTIFDVCLNTYGTLDHLVKLMDDNGHEGVDTYPVNGQQFTYDETLVNNISVNNVGSPAGVSGTLSPIKYATQNA